MRRPFARIILIFLCGHALLATSCLRTSCKDSSCSVIETAYLYSMLMNSTIFVAVGLSGSVRTSFDGKLWQTQTFGAATINAVGFDKNNFYGVGSTDAAITSSDALSWNALTSLNTGTSDAYFSVAANRGLLVAGGSAGSGQVRRSADNGVTWTNLPVTTAASELADLEYGGGALRGVNGAGEFMRFASDATAYTTSPVPGAPPALNALMYQAGAWVVVGNNGFVARSSDDGASWSTATLNATHSLFGVAYGNGRFVAAGHDGTNATIYTSTDSGANWVLSTPPFGRTRGVAFGNNVFVIIGNGGLMAYSETPEVTSSWVDVSSGAQNLFDISARSQQIFVGPLEILN